MVAIQNDTIKNIKCEYSKYQTHFRHIESE